MYLPPKTRAETMVVLTVTAVAPAVAEITVVVETAAAGEDNPSCLFVSTFARRN
jgi:hypothetical protein